MLIYDSDVILKGLPNQYRQAPADSHLIVLDAKTITVKFRL